MNLLPYLKNLTNDILGQQNCKHCGEVDYFFALEGECMECHKPIQKHDKWASFLYSASVLKEFIEKYDEFIIEMPQGKEFKVILLKELTVDIEFTRKFKLLPIPSRLEKHQIIFSNTPQIGSKKYEAAFIVKNSNPELFFNWEAANPMERIKSITAVLSSLRFILSV
jgi:hypothetical protein